MVYVIDVWRLCFFSLWGSLWIQPMKLVHMDMPILQSRAVARLESSRYGARESLQPMGWHQEAREVAARVPVLRCHQTKQFFGNPKKWVRGCSPINFNFGGISNCHVWSTKSISVDMCVCNYLWMLVWLFLEDPLKRCGSHSREEHRCRETLVFGSPFANSGGDPSRENAIFQSIPYIKGGATKCKIF